MKKILFLITTFIIINLSHTQAVAIKLTDIEHHWAKEHIERMVVNEKVNGYPDHTFRPDNEVTILELIKIMMDTLDVKLVEGGLNKWPDEYIATAKEHQLSYEYNQKATRYEAVEIISQLIDLTSVTSSKNKFKDVDARHFSSLSKLVKLKIINGYEDGTFRGENTLTRAEAVTMAIRTMEANQKIVENQKYPLVREYTNIDTESNKVKYEIQNGKLYFSDSGRFSDVQNYTIEEKYVTNQVLIHIIQELVSEDSFTGVYYVPSKYIIHQVLIKYGPNENAVNQNMEYFSLTYYEDKHYDLNRIALKEVFSHECYCKITIKKMWKEYYEFQKGNYIDEHIQKKLYQALSLEFGRNAEDIMQYMLEIYEQNAKQKGSIAEQVTIGKFIINTYQTETSNLEFYIEK